jgi:MATE family multidrug resistance protein
VWAFGRLPLFLQGLRQDYLKNPFSTYKPEMAVALKLAFPIILGQLGIILMGVTDTIMVGRLGKDVLASANQANNIFFMVSGITFGVLYAISTLVSIKVGENRAHESFITYRAGLVVSALLFVFQFIILEIIAFNFDWLGQDKAVTALAPDYLHIINWSILPMLVMVAARQFTDGLGHTLIAMYITLAGLLLNGLLCYLLIYGNWGFPKLGLAGAGWATLISRVLMAVAGMLSIVYHPRIKKYRPAVPPTWAEIKKEMPEIWTVGLPIALQTFAEWACFSISGIMVGWFGATRLAAHAVALNIASVTYMVVTGFAIAGSIMVGNAYGEENKLKIKRAANAVLWLIVAFEIVNALIFIFLNKPIARLYGVSSEVEQFVLPLLLLAAVFQLADGIQAGAMNLLRGIKDVNWSSAISVLSYWVVSLPLSYFLGVVLSGDVYGVWTGFTIGLFVAAIFGVIRFYYKHKSLSFDTYEYH